MRRDELEELHYIAPISNLVSILEHGILSHNRVSRMPHDFVAMAVVQKKREKVVVPGGRPLHDYVNLYVNARNKMYKVKSRHGDRSLCVLRVSPDVLDLPGVVITDQNASSEYVRFYASHDGLAYLDRDTVFAVSWRHPDDPIEEWRHGSIVCAEVLVPERVGPEFLLGAYVSCEMSRRAANDQAPRLAVSLNQRIFFR